MKLFPTPKRNEQRTFHPYPRKTLKLVNALYFEPDLRKKINKNLRLCAGANGFDITINVATFIRHHSLCLIWPRNPSQKNTQCRHLLCGPENGDIWLLDNQKMAV